MLVLFLTSKKVTKCNIEANVNVRGVQIEYPTRNKPKERRNLCTITVLFRFRPTNFAVLLHA